MTIAQTRAARRRTKNDNRWHKRDPEKSARREAAKAARANGMKQKK